MDILTNAEVSDLQPSMDLQANFEGPKSIFAQLVWTAEYFHNMAQEIHTTGAEYAKFVRISIQASLMLLKEHSFLLNPLQELQICLGLAQLYLEATENLATAEEHAQRAMSVALRAQLPRQKFVAELLLARVLQASLSPLHPKFLSSKIDEYFEAGDLFIAGTFQLILGQVQFSDDKSLYTLEQVSQNRRMCPAVRALSLLFQSGYELQAGSALRALDLLDEVTGLEPLQAQIRAMYLLQKHMVSIQCNLRKEGKEFMLEISNFIQVQQVDQWHKWSIDGGFDLIMDTERLYRVFWLNPDEFVLVFYILTAISLMNESKGKSELVFERCHAIIDGRDRNMGAKLLESGSKRAILDELSLRRSYLSFLVTAYETLLVFHRDGSIEKKLELLASLRFNDDPLSYYIQGLYNHRCKNFERAKSFYLKARNHKSSVVSKSLNELTLISSSQSEEIFVFSTLQLLLIVEGESESARDSEWYKLRQRLQLDLDYALASNLESSRLIGMCLAAIIFKLINSVYEDLILPDELLQYAGKSGKNTPFLAGLIYYVSMAKSTNLMQRKDLQTKLEKLSQRIGDDCSQGKFIRGLMLKERYREGNESTDLLYLHQQTENSE